MITHLVRIILIILLIALCIVYPFLTGGYDSLAMPLSTIAQGFGVLAVLIFQIAAAAPLTAASRARAIASSAEMIANIEAYREAQGRYPNSLLGVWKDYYPRVVGVERYYYRPERDAYNLYFEQPRFLLDNIGTREFVVYNPRDEHFMVSHPSCMLRLTPAQFASYGGWYEVHDAETDHWRYFWFD